MQNKILAIILLLVITASASAENQEDSLNQGSLLAARILSINRHHNFLVIDIGAEEAISEGSTLNLLKDGEKVAVLHAIRVREKVSACDIKHVKAGLTLKEGDVFSLTIPQGIPKTRPRIGPESQKEEKQESVLKKISSLAKGGKGKKPAGPLIGALPMMVHIEARKEIVNYYLSESLRDMNFVVTSSNTKEGIFTAHKFIAIPLWEELWADFKGSTDHRTIYDINTIDDESGTTLKLDIRIFYTDKAGRTKERSVRQNTETVKDAVELVRRVKNMSEILTKER